MRINDNCENKFQESDCFELKQAAKKKKKKKEKQLREEITNGIQGGDRSKNAVHLA